MPESSTGDEALPNGIEEGVNLLGAEGESSVDTNKGALPADSPPVEKKDDNKSLGIADAVRAALEPKKEQSSGSGEEEGEGEDDKSATPGTGDKKPEEGEGEDDNLTKEEFQALKPKTQRRIEKLARQNTDLTTRNAELEPKAQALDAFHQITKNANLNKEDVNTIFHIGGLMKNDPVKAWEVLKPIVAQLQVIVGEVLPKDLKDQVTGGKITPEAAQELSRLRAERGVNTTNQQQNAEREKRDRNARAAEAVQTLQSDVGTAISKWENDWKASDPDYSLKSSRVSEAIELELNRAIILAKEGKPNNLPRSVEEAVKMANDIKKRVEKEMRQFLPKRNIPLTHVTGNGVTNGSKPIPKNMNDVVRFAVGQK